MDEDIACRGLILNPLILINFQILVEKQRRAAVEVEGRGGHLSESSAEGFRILRDAIGEEFQEDALDEFGPFIIAQGSDAIDRLDRRVVFEREFGRHR